MGGCFYYHSDEDINFYRFRISLVSVRLPGYRGGLRRDLGFGVFLLCIMCVASLLYGSVNYLHLICVAVICANGFFLRNLFAFFFSRMNDISASVGFFVVRLSLRFCDLRLICMEVLGGMWVGSLVGGWMDWWVGWEMEGGGWGRPEGGHDLGRGWVGLVGCWCVGMSSDVDRAMSGRQDLSSHLEYTNEGRKSVAEIPYHTETNS